MHLDVLENRLRCDLLTVRVQFAHLKVIWNTLRSTSRIEKHEELVKVILFLYKFKEYCYVRLKPERDYKKTGV